MDQATLYEQERLANEELGGRGVEEEQANDMRPLQPPIASDRSAFPINHLNLINSLRYRPYSYSNNLHTQTHPIFSFPPSSSSSSFLPFPLPTMSAARGSVTPTGKRTTSTYDYPLTAQQQQQAALSTPISIQPRASPRGPGTSSIAVANAQISMAQSCPTFSWQPPPAPSARPRLPSVDPPPMELPPSPPVFSPMQAETLKGKKEEPTSVALKKQIYSRSLSNYSSSAPTHVDYLSKFHPNFGPLEEGGLDDSDEDQEEAPVGYKPSARTMQVSMRPSAGGEENSPSETRTGAIGIGIGAGGLSMKNRVQAVQRGDDFSLSKSPTIFSIMSTSHQNPPLGLYTADTSASSSGSSPGHSILGSIAAGGDSQKRRSLIGHKAPLSSTSPDAPKSQVDASGEDDLQFSISLTDEQDGEGEDSSQQDSMPLY